MKIHIPSGAKKIIDLLESAGFEAYVVGGCIRDSLLGKAPHDWDISTSARPDEMMQVFKDYRIIGTGLKHGTITVIIEDVPYEITTFRIDGEYTDNRHPESVVFTRKLREDLSRRDFTPNAIAYNDKVGLVDLFNGVVDLQSKILRCVGNADDRFQEDALRILRALRFSSVYSFAIEKETAEAIHRNRHLLSNISAERIQAELCKMLMGDNILFVLLNFSDVIATIIPEMECCIGFAQQNRYHQYTVYDHIAHAVANYTGDDLSVKLALLLHDIGKPLCYSHDEKGDHFYGHAVPGAEIAKLVMEKLRFDNNTKKEVVELVAYHDATIEPTPKVVRRWLNKVGEDRFRQMLEVRAADIVAHAEGTQEQTTARCVALHTLLEEIVKENQCFKLKDLAVKGRDLIAIGIPQNKLMGDILKALLDKVIAEELLNDRDILIKEAERIYSAQV